VTLATGLSVGLFVLLLAALSLARRRDVSGATVTLLRSLFPSWRFFETPEGQVLLLSRRVSPGLPDDAQQPFTPAIPAPHRGLADVLFSARGNLLLACHDLVDALVQELAEQGETKLEHAEQLVSYRLVQNMVRWHLRQPEDEPSAYQMKLISLDAQGNQEQLFVSPVYPCS
jgi:hypothetical protein